MVRSWNDIDRNGNYPEILDEVHSEFKPTHLPTMDTGHPNYKLHPPVTPPRESNHIHQMSINGGPWVDCDNDRLRQMIREKVLRPQGSMADQSLSKTLCDAMVREYKQLTKAGLFSKSEAVLQLMANLNEEVAAAVVAFHDAIREG